ncbi:hypothetical protein Y1Q_0011837 [Alligator mississippiensis]|uniref:Uncharacterized protein n=1 Tax=Alligator mississippiensis TaxID=8496 RepID=A0A151LYN4_ALLMI|nr:hypothetical protein Y1Q_0011837 [Alligator mississippiensis]
MPRAGRNGTATCHLHRPNGLPRGQRTSSSALGSSAAGPGPARPKQKESKEECIKIKLKESYSPEFLQQEYWSLYAGGFSAALGHCGK